MFNSKRKYSTLFGQVCDIIDLSKSGILYRRFQEDFIVELEVRKRRAQLYRYQGVGAGICILAAFYLFYMVWEIDSDFIRWKFGIGSSALITVSICIVYALLVAIACLIMRLGSIKIAEILATECDPFLYEACIQKNSRLLYKDRLLCSLALAQHYQGNFDRAWETLQGINVYKLHGIHRANYYILMSDQYFKRGMGQQVRELEERYRQSVKTKNKREWKYFETLCAGNNLTRALENQDYQAAAGFLGERIALNGNASRPWTRVIFALKEAQIYLGLGEKESARLCLKYVVENGNRMWCVQEALRLSERI